MAKHESTEASWQSYSQGWMENMKEAAGWQMKNAELFLDFGIRMSQTMADFYQTQASEGMKLAQHCLTSGKQFAEQVTDGYRRQVSTMNEKAQRSV